MNTAIAVNNTAILIILLAILAAVIIYQHLKARRLLNEQKLLRLTNSAAMGGYYLWDIKNNTETISPALSSMLNFRSENASITDITNLFGNKKQDFMDNIAALREGRINNFILNVTANLADGAKELQCTGNAVIDSGETVAAIIIWFFDISEYAKQIKHLSAQNNQLTKEVRDYSSIFNTIPLPIWKRDKGMDIKFCNFIYSKFVEGEGEKITPSSTPELDPNLRQLSSIARSNDKQLRMKKHLVIEGTRRFYSINEMAIKNSDETLGYGYDITDQDEIEKELARHISAHSDLLESSSSAIAIYGPDTKLKFYNNAFVNLWGLKVKWLDTNPTYGEVLEVLREKRKLPEQADFKKFRKEQMFLFQDITKPHEDLMHLPDGKAIRIITIPHALGGLLFAYEDVTDRLAMQRSYNTLIAVQKETLDNLSEGVAVFGENGRIKLYNPLYIKMWAEDDEYLEKQPHLSDMLERAKKLYDYRGNWLEFKQNMINAILGGKYTSLREELSNERIIDIISRPLPNGDKMVSFVDVTSTILAEKSLLARTKTLEEADRLKTEFLNNMSYELRTPLTSVIGFSEILLNPAYFGKLNPRQEDYIRGILESSNGLLEQINDVLDLVSIDAGYMVLDLKEVDVYKATSGVVKLLQKRCQEEKLSMKLACEKAIGIIKADELRIKQVIYKLVSNSIKYTKPGGKITVGAGKKGQNVEIWVEDTGVGIANKDKGKVFDRFFKTNSAMLMNRSGVGIGLAVVKDIVELHGGTVKLESQEGKGTKVTLILKGDTSKKSKKKN